MKFAIESGHRSPILMATVLLTAAFGLLSPTAQAAPDYLFFSINGDTTVSTMTQGDELAWGANCNPGATVNWEIWFDLNSNSIIDPASDPLIMSENMTDGYLFTDPDGLADGWLMEGGLNLFGEPGQYIFRATDPVTMESVQRVATMTPMASPPNQFTGQIVLPGISAPDPILAGRLLFGESDSDVAGVMLAATDAMGNFSMVVGNAGTGIDFYLDPPLVPGFVKPEGLIVTAGGLKTGNDFSYTVATDSVWGYVLDETGDTIPFESDVRAESFAAEKQTMTSDGKYTFYFDESDKGDWQIDYDSRVSPLYVSTGGTEFSHDTLTSFQHDITIYTADTGLWIRVTENGGLPSSNYLVNAWSDALSGYSEGVSGTGSDNLIRLGISSLDPGSWYPNIATWDDEYPIPSGFIVDGANTSSAPGDTVILNLIAGQELSGTLTQDPEDGPAVWDDIQVGAFTWVSPVNGDGSYTLYTDTGTMSVSVWSDMYLAVPQWHNVDVSGDISGLDFTINERHCVVTGTLTGVTLPLDNPYYNVTGYTGSGTENDYGVWSEINPQTGQFTVGLCEGDWTLIPPVVDASIPPAPIQLTIGEIPDTTRAIEFVYTSSGCCGLYTGGFTGNTDCGTDGKRNLADVTRLIDRVFLSKATLCCEENGNVDGDVEAKMNLADVTRLIDHVFLSKAPTAPCE